MKRELFDAAVECLANGGYPLDVEFVEKHDLPLTEQFEITDMMALGGELVQWALDHPIMAQAALAASDLMPTKDRLAIFLEKVK